MLPRTSLKPMFANFRKAISLALIVAFVVSSLYAPQSRAGEMVMPIMPKPGVMVDLSPVFTPAFLKGIVIHPDNALKFDFLIRKGDGGLDQDQKMQEYNTLVKYFLASLTVPEGDQWVNLSPYEKNRIINTDFGKTQMGHDLLGQDYLLKQIASSLMYPESGLGKVFWDKVFAKAYKEFGTTDIPVNTFNKVWIVPDDALIYENGNMAYIVKSHLKVMLEEDYLSLEKHTAIENPDPKKNALHAVSSKVIKEVILPQIEREVNEGKNFAMLRQVYSGMLLATWYKKALRESLLGKVYANKAKVQGVDQDPQNNEKIYRQYLAAFKKGVYNFVREDEDKFTNQIIPRKYFAGGFDPRISQTTNMAQVSREKIDEAMTTDNASATEDRAVVEVNPARALAMAPAQLSEGMAIDDAKEAINAHMANVMMRGALLPASQRGPKRKLVKALGQLEAERILTHENEGIVRVYMHRNSLPAQVRGAIDVLMESQSNLEHRLKSWSEWVNEKQIHGGALAGQEVVAALQRMMEGTLKDNDQNHIINFIEDEKERLMATLSPEEQSEQLAQLDDFLHDVSTIREKLRAPDSVISAVASGRGDYAQSAQAWDLLFAEPLQRSFSRLYTLIHTAIVYANVLHTQPSSQRIQEAYQRNLGNIETVRESLIAKLQASRTPAPDLQELLRQIDTQTGTGLNNDLIDRIQTSAKRSGVDAAMLMDQLKPYEEMGSAYKESPAIIKNMMYDIGQGFVGTSPEEKANFALQLGAATGFMDATRKFYEKMMLAIENYHNHLHHLIVTEGALILASPLIKERRDLIVTFAAALWHDLHLREVWPGGEEKPASPAWVYETLGRPGTDTGGQLPDLLGINGFTYKNPAIGNARYEVTREDKRNFQRLFRQLVGKEDLPDLEKVYAEIAAIIFRTDYVSEIPPANNTYKNKAFSVRDRVDEIVNEWTGQGIEMTDTMLNGLIETVKSGYQDILKELPADRLLDESTRPTQLNWLNRQQDVELNFLEALRKVDDNRRTKVYQLANMVELSDQSSSAWIGTVPFSENVSKGLMKELPPSVVNVETNFPGFYEPNLTNQRVLPRMNALPLNFKANFITLMDNYAKRASNYAKNVLKSPVSAGISPEKFNQILYSWNRWRVAREEVMMQWGIYQDYDKEFKEQQPTYHQAMQQLRKTILGQSVSLTDLYYMLRNRILIRENKRKGQVIIRQGENPGLRGRMYFIVSGSVNVIQDGHLVKTITPGADGNVGEMAFLNHSSRNATIEAAEEGAVLYALKGTYLHGLRLENPYFNKLLLGQIPGRSRPDFQEDMPALVRSQPIIKIPVVHEDVAVLPPHLENGMAPSEEILAPEQYQQLIMPLVDQLKAEYPDDMSRVRVVAVMTDRYNAVPPLPPAVIYDYPKPNDKGHVLVLANELLRPEVTQEERVKAVAAAFDMAMITEQAEMVRQMGGERPTFKNILNLWGRVVMEMPDNPAREKIIADLNQGRFMDGLSKKEELGKFVKNYGSLDPRIMSIYNRALENERDPAMMHEQTTAKKPTDLGGIDLNAANMQLQIKRDGKGEPLPLSQQDMAQLAGISGFVPRILEIKPVSSLPLFSEK